VSVHQALWYFLTINLKNMKTPESMEVDPDDNEPTDEGDI
jgi:hypothetical protein